MAEAQCGFCPSRETKAGEVMQFLMWERLQKKRINNKNWDEKRRIYFHEQENKFSMEQVNINQ